MSKIIMSALGPSLAEQCDDQGLAATGTDTIMSQRLADAVNLCYVRGVLTDSEANRARRRIIVGMRLRQVRAAKTEARASQPTTGAGA